jgi:hypothetical protein
MRLPRHFRVLQHAAKLQHGTDDFTFPSKEGILRIFSLEKSVGFGRVWTHELGYQRPKCVLSEIKKGVRCLLGCTVDPHSRGKFREAVKFTKHSTVKLQVSAAHVGIWKQHKVYTIVSAVPKFTSNLFQSTDICISFCVFKSVKFPYLRSFSTQIYRTVLLNYQVFLHS